MKEDNDSTVVEEKTGTVIPEQTAEPDPAAEPASAEEPLAAEPVPAKKRKKGLLISLAVFLGILAVCVLTLPFLIPFLREQKKKSVYNEGVALLEAENYEEALAKFTKLGSMGAYKDSEDLRKNCEKGLLYRSAVERMEEGRYREARDMLSGLRGFRNSKSLVSECEAEIAYQDGKALYAAGLYDEAEEKLGQAAEHEDTKEMLAVCADRSGLIRIRKAMDLGRYDKALELLQDADPEQVPDIEGLKKECENGITYAKADAAFKEERYYTALRLFTELGDYKDAKERAGKCEQTPPETQELYHNSTYVATDVSLEITAPESSSIRTDFGCMYFKIYEVRGTDVILVSTSFMQRGGSVTVKLPEGEYMLKYACGTAAWYGEKEMFGSHGLYHRLYTDGNCDAFALKGHRNYKLDILDWTNRNIGVKSEKREDF
ncbi:MAG: hypothetical protein J5845_04720 [Lachnospiraceae bacterium]|nr:hypothetical protein [Lachnospiraceae bacterium]